MYDLFHVVARYGREVIDHIRSIRADQANALCHDKPAHLGGWTWVTASDYPTTKPSRGPWALGRSNWLFAGSLRSGKRSAALMTLIQSARLNGHDPHAST